MLSRRSLLLTAGASGLLAGCATAPPLVPAAPPPIPQPQPAAQLAAVLQSFYEEALEDSPTLVTFLGLDTGERAAARSQLDDASMAHQEAMRALNADQLARMKAIDRSALSGADAVNYDSIIFSLETTDEADRHFPYGRQGAGSPYVLSQLSGAYQDVPSFLANQHKVETKADAEAYLARLEAFGRVMDQETERARHDIGLGVVPPDFIIDQTLKQMRGLRAPAGASTLVTALTDRTTARGIAGDYAARAQAIYRETVAPALGRQIALMEEARPRAVHEAGCWRLPDGEAYYALSLKVGTTTRMTAQEVHQLGLDQARELSGRADALFRKIGMSQGTVAQRYARLAADPAQLYPDTDEGKVALIGDLNKLVAAMRPRLPQYFSTLPRAPVEIKRVPKFIEAGAPGGYYQQPSLDGTRPGIYWINLRDTAENPRWALPTLTYHEAMPGHHMQLAIQQETDLPMIRRINFYSAYGEGWALYAEQLAVEMGVYEGDPRGELGQIQAALFRAARLVVDTGLHAKRWSREQAITAMVEINGDSPSAVATEIERYCVWPGQATSYLVGKLTWLRLRAQARAALGDGFDIRRFHDAGLLSGAVPLVVLERVIGDYLKEGA